MGRFEFLRGGLRLNVGGGDGDGEEDDDERDDGVVPVGLSVYFPSIYSSNRPGQSSVSKGRGIGRCRGWQVSRGSSKDARRGRLREPRLPEHPPPNPREMPLRSASQRSNTNSSRGGLLVAGLASDLEGNTVGGGILELEGGGREVVEVLVEELQNGAKKEAQRLAELLEG